MGTQRVAASTVGESLCEGHVGTLSRAMGTQRGAAARPHSRHGADGRDGSGFGAGVPAVTSPPARRCRATEARGPDVKARWPPARPAAWRRQGRGQAAGSAEMVRAGDGRGDGGRGDAGPPRPGPAGGAGAGPRAQAAPRAVVLRGDGRERGAGVRRVPPPPSPLRCPERREPRGRRREGLRELTPPHRLWGLCGVTAGCPAGLHPKPASQTRTSQSEHLNLHSAKLRLQNLHL